MLCVFKCLETPEKQQKPDPQSQKQRTDWTPLYSFNLFSLYHSVIAEKQ